MSDRNPYVPATAVLVLLAVAATAAGFWLAVTSQWVGAAGAAVTAIIAAGLLTIIAEAQQPLDPEHEDKTVPWTANEPDTEAFTFVAPTERPARKDWPE